MHYVKQFHINGVDTMQVACIELHGKPNAATEGAVGVFGIDVDSPTYDLYWCVDVTGSIYTWKPCSSLGLAAKVESLEELIMDTLNEYQDSTARVDELDAEVTEFMKNADERIDKIESDTSEFVEESTERMDKMESDVSDFIGESTEKINGLETEVSEFVGSSSERMSALEADVAELMYIQNPLTITKFESTVKNARFGQELTDITFSWGFSQVPKSVTLCDKNGNTISTHATDSTGATLNGLSVTTDTTWKLKATDRRDKAVTKDTSITFLHGVYWGVGAPRDSYDSDFVNTLSVEWRTTKKPSITVSPNTEHIYYCLPTRMGECNFSVGTMPGGFEQVGEPISVTNIYGGTQTYYIYRSTELLDKDSVVVNIS